MVKSNFTPTLSACQERISKKSLNEIERGLAVSLDAIRKAQGKRGDQVQELCDQVGISKRELAAGIVLSCKGDITITDLASRLKVTRRAIYYWPEIQSAVKAMQTY